MQALLDEIESTEFWARTGIASGLGMFKRIVLDIMPKDLFYGIEDYKLRDDIVERVKRLVPKQPDEGYLHEGDAAIATFLLLLQMKGDWVRIRVALRAMEGMQGGYWAIRVAQELQDVVMAMSEPRACEDLCDRPVEMFGKLPPRMTKPVAIE